MIFFAGITIGFFISALLLVKKNKTKSDYTLLLWMLLNTIQLLFYYLMSSEIIYEYPHLLGVQLPFPLLQGVLLFYYVSSLTKQVPTFKIPLWGHLLPLLITYAYLIPFFCLPAAQKIDVFQQNGKGYEIFQFILLLTVMLSGLAYVIGSSILLNQHKESIRNQFSDIEAINLRWLQFLTYGLGIIWILVIVSQNDTLIYEGVSVFVILIGFLGIQQKDIFNNDKNKGPLTKEVPVTKEKYTKSGLSSELADQLYEQLTHLMTQKTFYKNNDLSLSDLATELDTHQNYLSQIINEKEGKSFYDYVNTFRVEEFKRLIGLPAQQQFTLMATAYECGFNSKSSFNRYFKKITGQTPSQYVKTVIK